MNNNPPDTLKDARNLTERGIKPSDAEAFVAFVHARSADYVCHTDLVRELATLEQKITLAYIREIEEKTKKFVSEDKLLSEIRGMKNWYLAGGLALLVTIVATIARSLF